MISHQIKKTIKAHMAGTMLPAVFLSFLNICNNLRNYLYKSDYAYCMNRHGH